MAAPLIWLDANRQTCCSGTVGTHSSLKQSKLLLLLCFIYLFSPWLKWVKCSLQTSVLIKPYTQDGVWALKNSVGGQYLYVGEESLYRRQAIWEEKWWGEAWRQGLAGQRQPLVAVSGCWGANGVLLCEENQWKEVNSFTALNETFSKQACLRWQQFIDSVEIVWAWPPELPSQQAHRGRVFRLCCVAFQALNAGLSKNHPTHKSSFHH